MGIVQKNSLRAGSTSPAETADYMGLRQFHSNDTDGFFIKASARPRENGSLLEAPLNLDSSGDPLRRWKKAL
jgi:hypothetical protein